MEYLPFWMLPFAFVLMFLGFPVAFCMMITAVLFGLAVFGERVIFRELFVQGLTLLDLRESGTALSMSHVAAREEVRALLETIAIPGLAARVA